MLKVGEYVNQWTQYQALWDLQPDVLYENLYDDLDKWMKVLVEIKKSRSLVDTQDTEYEVFPFIVDYNKVQTKVSVKYDYWQREVLSKFSVVLGKFLISFSFQLFILKYLASGLQKFYEEISKWREHLESHSIDSSNTSDTVSLITFVQFLKKQVKSSQLLVNFNFLKIDIQ